MQNATVSKPFEPCCSAQVEASSARKGVGLVKLMGRQSGFIAMQASMASGGRGQQAGNPI